MTTTYTIALDGDVLMATAPDGNESMMAVRLADTLSAFTDDRDAIHDRITYVDGLTLYRSIEDAEDDGAEVIYSGTDMGWLEDENGETGYQAAGRK